MPPNEPCANRPGETGLSKRVKWWAVTAAGLVFWGGVLYLVVPALWDDGFFHLVALAGVGGGLIGYFIGLVNASGSFKQRSKEAAQTAMLGAMAGVALVIVGYGCGGARSGYQGIPYEGW